MATPLDIEARLRGNSVYFPRRVIPMLPEELSNGLCSLNPQVERLCLTCEMAIGPRGDIKDYRFYPAVMFSHARLTYTTVAAIIADAKSEPAREHRRTGAAPAEPGRICSACWSGHVSGAAPSTSSRCETRMEFDDQGKITAIYPVERNDAHRLIEECMLAANVCASDFLQSPRAPGAVSHPRGPHAGEAGGPAAVPARVRPATGRRRRPARQGLRQAAERDPRPA